MHDIVIAIPAYQPGKSLLELVVRLKETFPSIIVVDDGSTTDAAEHAFARLGRLGGVTVVRHGENRGKGAALKTAFAEATARFPDLAGIVTADADGQHLPEDIVNVAKATTANPDRYTLGVRQFAGDIPLRSRLGNSWTRIVFRLLTGTMVSDTQTGLRGIPRQLLPEAMEIKGERYEYETRMLVAAVRRREKPVQIPIQTVYANGNSTSHYRPLLDTFRTQAALLSAAVGHLPRRSRGRGV